jgi:hypothetical protein
LRSRASFGFKPTVDDVQGGNTAEYLLRGLDGHLYYVTPLTPKATKSQAFWRTASARSPTSCAAGTAPRRDRDGACRRPSRAWGGAPRRREPPGPA